MTDGILVSDGGTGFLQSGWQPIETAPMNVLVLLYTPAIKGVVTRESAICEVGYASHGQVRSDGRVRGVSWHGYATHWMPLPPPPKQ